MKHRNEEEVRKKLSWREMADARSQPACQRGAKELSRAHPAFGLGEKAAP